MRNVITNAGEVILPVGNEFSRYNHMLRKADRKTVPDVMEFMHNKGMDVYLGGGAVSDWITYGNREYFDIDLIGVARTEEARLALTKELDQLTNPANLQYVPNYSEEERLGSIVIGGRTFRISDPTLQLIEMYMGGSVDERFILLPKPTLWERMTRKPSMIDVSLVSKDGFAQ